MFASLWGANIENWIDQPSVKTSALCVVSLSVDHRRHSFASGNTIVIAADWWLKHGCNVRKHYGLVCFFFVTTTYLECSFPSPPASPGRWWTLKRSWSRLRSSGPACPRWCVWRTRWRREMPATTSAGTDTPREGRFFSFFGRFSFVFVFFGLV